MQRRYVSVAFSVMRMAAANVLKIRFSNTAIESLDLYWTVSIYMLRCQTLLIRSSIKPQQQILSTVLLCVIEFAEHETYNSSAQE